MASVALWKQILRKNFTDINKLTAYLELDDKLSKQCVAFPQFPLNLPLRLAEKIKKNTLDDPILKQFVPLAEEYVVSKDFFEDPLAEKACRKSTKLLHKYHGRVLLVCTSACAMHCRYCFRRHFDYNVADKIFEKELALIEADETINEVILSGGDPLSLDDKLLEDLLSKIEKIGHVKKIRFHTRFPIGIPERIDDSFLQMLAAIPLQKWFVIHVNHPVELDDDIFAALKKLQMQGITILCQSVLLRGINDDADTLVELCSKLVDHGIIPYYLHQLDRVQGAAHFEVDQEKGKSLIEAISSKLPGYAIPKYVEEIPGQSGKTPI